eukprot:TRINITY_DN3845_c0_g1_i1.p1 TRINITY_DN3845_c0_g1~~TRINITY_DN3845_c0_g1_i1.p1  ORF type:complete len:426 (+),score=156.85 TRINITY_DN3845_c0_g1_i1:114-1280(+)
MDKPKTAPVIHERPKMPRATWEALRGHIISERKRKQEEEVRSEEYERLKKEREHRKKQEATSLEETKEQIVELEKKLTNLKEEKHMLFLTLKKVLNEDDSRRRRDDEMYGGGAPQHPPVLPLTGHTPHNQHMFMNPQSRQPSHAAAHYMKQHLPGLQAQQVKRPRSPSPPRTIINAVNSAYFRPSPLSHARIPAVSSVYGHPSAVASGGGAPTYALSTSSSGSVYPFSSASQAAAAAAAANREEVDRKQVYLSQPGRYIQQIESAAAAAAASKQQPPAGYASERDRQASRLAAAAAAAALPPGAAGGRGPPGQPVALTTSRPGGPISSGGFPLRASVANSLINTVAPSLSSSQAAAVFSQAAAAAQIVASQQNQAAAAQRFYQGVRDH